VKIIVKQENFALNELKKLAESCLSKYKLPVKKAIERAKRKDFTLLFAFNGKKRIGFIAGYAEKRKMHIWLFGVLKKNRGKGIGSKLLNRFHSISLKKDYKSVTTITFNKYKEKLILSLKHGYRITGLKHIHAKNDDTIFLEKVLKK